MFDPDTDEVSDVPMVPEVGGLVLLDRDEEPGEGTEEREVKTLDSDRRGVGAEALFYASIEQKITDCKALQKLGVIVNGACVKEWPRTSAGKPKVFINDYENPSHVNALLKWLKGDEDGMKGCLEFLGSNIKPEDVLKALGLEVVSAA